MSAQPSAHLATGKESQPQLKTNSRKKLFSKERKSAAATAAAATLSQKALRVLNMQKPSKYYPAESVRLPRLSRKKPSLGKLRESIKPGTVLILLSGNYSGKRVVFLKRLEESGMLLVTGPFKVNGVPLRRVNQAFVLATSTKVNVDEVLKNEVAHVTDALFNSIKTSKPRSKPTEAGMFEEKSKVFTPLDFTHTVETATGPRTHCVAKERRRSIDNRHQCHQRRFSLRLLESIVYAQERPTTSSDEVLNKHGECAYTFILETLLSSFLTYSESHDHFDHVEFDGTAVTVNLSWWHLQ